jgi:soluble lytic murein transglycosylase-like protein
MAMTAQFYHLPPRVLPSIQRVEGGHVGTAARNTDGSEDLGVMQVNSRWIGPVARLTGQPEHEVRSRLLSDPCFNIAVAGAILKNYWHEARGNMMIAIGYYHSHTPARGEAYQAKVLASARQLFQHPPRQEPTRATNRRQSSAD